MRANRPALSILLLAAAFGLLGFDTSKHSIPREEILSGGPPKDGIPALLEPRFIPASQAEFLHPSDRVVGLEVNGTAKAYPIRILNWHEVVNDELGASSVAVTYCPLTNSAVVYDRQIGGKTLSFGVSGLLYRSNVLFYDHQTESLWSQLKEEAVTGALTGNGLKPIPSVVTTWANWYARHPGTLVLSVDTGHRRDYGRDPYARYHRSSDVFVPLEHSDARLAEKSGVLGVEVGDVRKAYPLDALSSLLTVEDEIEGKRLRIHFEPDGVRARLLGEGGETLIPTTIVYWFAWAAFHPETLLWTGDSGGDDDDGRTDVTGRAIGAAGVEVGDHRAYWTNIFGIGLQAGGTAAGANAGLLVISGKLRNRSPNAIDHVEIVFELLDRDGRVVASESGYNRSAEILRPVDSPLPVAVPDAGKIRPIPRDATDTFRMMFLGDELPDFESYRVRVIDGARRR